jgi:hypothetical protein
MYKHLYIYLNTIQHANSFFHLRIPLPIWLYILMTAFTLFICRWLVQVQFFINHSMDFSTLNKSHCFSVFFKGWYSDFWILKTQWRGYLIPLLITYRVLTVHLFPLRRGTYSYVSTCSNLVKFYVILFHFDVHVQCIFQIIKETWVKLVI